MDNIEEEVNILEKYINHFDYIGGEEIIKNEEIIKTIKYEEIVAIRKLIQWYKENKTPKIISPFC